MKKTSKPSSLGKILGRMKRDRQVDEARRQGSRQTHFAKLQKVLKGKFDEKSEIKGWGSLFSDSDCWADLCKEMEQKQPEQRAFLFLLAFKGKWKGKGISAGTGADEEAILWTGEKFVKKDGKSGPAATICRIEIPRMITESLDDRKDKFEARKKDVALGSKAKKSLVERDTASLNPKINEKLLPGYIKQLPDSYGRVWRVYQNWHHYATTRNGVYWIFDPLKQGDRVQVFNEMENSEILKPQFYEITCALQRLIDLIIVDRITTYQFFKSNATNSAEKKQSLSVQAFEDAILACPRQVVSSIRSMLGRHSDVMELDISEVHKKIDAKAGSQLKEAKCLSMLKRQMDKKYTTEKCSVRKSVRRITDALEFYIKSC